MGCDNFRCSFIAPQSITQIGLAIPLLILYELSIFSVRFIEKELKIQMRFKKIERF